LLAVFIVEADIDSASVMHLIAQAGVR